MGIKWQTFRWIVIYSIHPPGLPMRAGQAGPPRAGIKCLHTRGLATMCRADVPGCVSTYFCSQQCPEQESAFVDSSVDSEGFLGGASGKEPACHCRRHKRLRFDPWFRKIQGRRAWQPTPVLLPGESHGQRSLANYSP